MIAIRNISQRNFSVKFFPPARPATSFTIQRCRQWINTWRGNFSIAYRSTGACQLEVTFDWRYIFCMRTHFYWIKFSHRFPYFRIRFVFRLSLAAYFFFLAFFLFLFFCSSLFGDMNDKWIMSVAFVFYTYITQAYLVTCIQRYMLPFILYCHGIG